MPMTSVCHVIRLSIRRCQGWLQKENRKYMVMELKLGLNFPFGWLKHTKTEKPRQDRSNIKMMQAVFFDVFVTNICPPPTYYIKILKSPKDAIYLTRSKIWRSVDYFFHCKNHSSHSAPRIGKFFTKTLLPQARFSPDIPSCEFFLLFKLKGPLKGGIFLMVPEIRQRQRRRWKTQEKRKFRFDTVLHFFSCLEIRRISDRH